MDKSLGPAPKFSIKAFTLVEIMVVIVIVGILTSRAFTQYTAMVEKSRIADARMRISLMRQLALQFWIKSGSSLTGIVDDDVGVDNTCSSLPYAYWIQSYSSPEGWINLAARRCNVTRMYYYYLRYYLDTGVTEWHCCYADDLSSCYGLPP
jgi:prepilin-type N-terminal cleavage/methylation domain-containing protein